MTNKKKSQITQGMVRNIPGTVQESAGREIWGYSVSMVAVMLDDGVPSADPIGSGTLIQSGNKRGILTASHVLTKSYYSHRRCIRIGLNIMEDTHHCSIKKEFLTPIHVGHPVSNSEGPDLAVILLPDPFAGTVAAKRSFWNIDVHRKKLLENPLDNDLGAWTLFGCPQEMVTVVAPPSGFDSTIGITGMAGYSGIEREWTEAGFDYLEYPVSYDSESEAPLSFKGVSGGGLWQVPLRKDKDGNMTHDRPILSGVGFYQTAVENSECSIICHGRRSIYEKVYEALNQS